MAATSRLVGLDVARCLALLGMVATHLIATRTTTGAESWSHVVAGGRSAALFAVLAGVTLALASGGRTPVRGRARWVAVGGLAARAVLIAGLGLALGVPSSGVAVILTYYGVLFLAGIPFLGLGPRSLGLLAAGWLLVAPVVSHLLRPELPVRRFDSPSFEQLHEPTLLVSELLVTGYYPVLTWLAYLLAGMAVGRSDLARRSVQVGLSVGGVVVAIVATALSAVLTQGRFSDAVLDQVRTDSYGTTPTGGGLEWLLVSAPHSGTPFDLAQTIGSALAVTGGCLLVIGALRRADRRVVSVVFGAGTMTLTLYSVHVCLRASGAVAPEGAEAMLIHVLLLGSAGAVFVLVGWRGPLEVLVGLPGRALRRWWLPPGNRATVAAVPPA